MPVQGPARRGAPKAAQPTFAANPQQAAAIAHRDGPAAFIAAAGTGKTAILVQRLARLIADEGIDPSVILCVTFTRAAAEEMKKRATAALRGRGKLVKDLKDLRVVTFHGLGHLMLREKLEWTPQELNKALISGDPRQWLAEDILRPWRSNRTRGMNWNAPVADLLAAVDRAKEAQIAPDASADFFRDDLIFLDDMAKRYQEFFIAYEETKKKGKLYDLADLIYVPLGLLNSSPTYRKKWQGRFHYLQVDETQDTNPSQYQLIQYLAAPKHNVVVVGDPDQAIYGFRGSTPEESILSFRTMYPTGKIYPIEHNYRSTPQILAAANSLIAHNDAHEGFEKQLRPTQPDGPPVSIIAYEDQEREAEGIADGIQRIVNETRGGPEPLSYKDIFVLSRTNHHLASLEITLARHRIPYRAVGGSSFFKRKTTRDILAYLALVDGMRQYEEYVARRSDPSAPRLEEIFTPVLVGEQDAAFRTVAYIPSRGYATATGKTSHRFTPTFFGMLAAFSGGKTLMQCCEEQPYSIPPEYQLGVKDCVALIRAVTHASHNRPATAIRSIRELAYDAHLRQRDGKRAGEDDEAEDDEAARDDDDSAKAEARFDELEELTRIADKHHTIRHFLQAMAQLKDQAEDASKSNRDCVQLMTIHKSKGLEQKVVFVMGLVEGIFPHRRSYSLDNSDGLVLLSGIAEERRLAYVAITRAQRQLYLTTLLRYRGVDATPSRFIHEAGLEATDVGETLHPFLLREEMEG